MYINCQYSRIINFHQVVFKQYYEKSKSLSMRWVEEYIIRRVTGEYCRRGLYSDKLHTLRKLQIIYNSNIVSYFLKVEIFYSDV